MLLELKRCEFSSTSTIGDLYVDGVWQCFVLEDAVREINGAPVASWKLRGRTAIPRGRYRVRISQSARFGRETPELLEVPGFLGIRIHPGNVAADTEGCLLPGLTKSPDWVGKSRAAYAALEAAIRSALTAGEIVQISVS